MYIYIQIVLNKNYVSPFLAKLNVSHNFEVQNYTFQKQNKIQVVNIDSLFRLNENQLVVAYTLRRMFVSQKLAFTAFFIRRSKRSYYSIVTPYKCHFDDKKTDLKNVKNKNRASFPG